MGCKECSLRVSVVRDSDLPSVVASGRLEVDEAFLEADTFGAFEEFEVLVEVTVSEMDES